ncbi:hypothetical protein ACN47E_002853 [Coniothyrium glycines]
MSAHHEASESTSRTPLEAVDVVAASNVAIYPPINERPSPSPISSPSREPTPAPASALALGPSLEDATAVAAAMLSTMSAPNRVLGDALFVDDVADNRSSSLSELGDASDDQSDSTPRLTIAADIDEDDSEAETERLENTPRKLARTATDTSILSDPIYTRTPSKLAQSRTVEQGNSAPPTPSIIADDATTTDIIDTNNPLHSLSLIAASEAANLEYTGRKRKRKSAEEALIDEQEDEPARKRSGNLKTLSDLAEAAADSADQVDADEELDIAEERLSQLAHEELDLEERQANIAAETVNELATVAKHTKTRKGGRRGKRKTEDPTYGYNESIPGPDNQENEVEVEGDEENSAALDEEVARKKLAIDKLAEIEKKFKVFREKLCDEQIMQLNRELEMLKQPHCLHPEYLAMIKCIDDRRAEKMAYESRLLEYKQKNLEIITSAERHQMHSQYFQTVRHVREEMLEECNQRVFELQKGRRQLGAIETEYMIKLPEKRSDQIRHQTAYNLEVSILSGVAKYVGFPAAPDISAARPTEIDEDLRAMKIATRTPAPPPSFRTYNRLSTADEAAAAEDFMESTPWANPRHPSHGPTRMASYQTPAGQRRMVDLTAPNGSASTIEATSNPPSSNAHNVNGRLGESESPVLQMKRPPTDHTAYGETTGSHARNLGVLGRDTYSIMSSPAQHLDIADDPVGLRWGARPINAGSVPTSGPRPDPARVPFVQQRNSTVSVGNGLFGR